MYRNVLTGSGWDDPLKWFDLAGNHDCRDVSSREDQENWFVKYGIQTQEYRSGKGIVFAKDFSEYSIVGFHQCLEPGWKRMMSFFGEFHDRDYEGIKNELSRQKDLNRIGFAFGHFPLSMVTGAEHVMDLMADSGISHYFCGHIHDRMGWNLHSMKSNGLLEAEAVDFKKNRIFRIITIDNGIVDFHDVKLNSFPILIFTSPKSSSRFSKYDSPVDQLNLLVIAPEYMMKDLKDPVLLNVPQSICDLKLSSSQNTSKAFTCNLEREWLLSKNFHRIYAEQYFKNNTLAAKNNMEFSFQNFKSPLGNSANAIFLNVTFNLLFSTLFAFLWTFLFLIVIPFSYHTFHHNIEYSSADFKEHSATRMIWKNKSFMSRFPKIRNILEWIVVEFAKFFSDPTTFQLYNSFGWIILLTPLIGGHILRNDGGLVFVWGAIYFEPSISLHFNLTDAWICGFWRMVKGILYPLCIQKVFSTRIHTEMEITRKIFKFCKFAVPLYWMYHEFVFLRQIVINYGWISIFCSNAFILDSFQIFLIMRHLFTLSPSSLLKDQ
jgi:DNA repair exonuclease SbcCD nuclease subunit